MILFESRPIHNPFECKYQTVIKSDCCAEEPENTFWETRTISFLEDFDRIFSMAYEIENGFRLLTAEAEFEENLSKIKFYDICASTTFTCIFSNFGKGLHKHIVVHLFEVVDHLFLSTILEKPCKCKISVDDTKADERQISSWEEMKDCFSYIPKRTLEKKVTKIFAKFHTNAVTLETVYNDSNKIKLEFSQCPSDLYYSILFHCNHYYIQPAFDPPLPSPTPPPSTPPEPKPLVENTEAQEEKKETKKKTRACVLV